MMLAVDMEKDITARIKGPNPDLSGLSALIIGMGDSGKAATELLLTEGVEVWAYDADQRKEDELRTSWEHRNVRVFCGELHPMPTIDFCVISPGVPPVGSFFKWAEETGVPLIGEMELACRFIQRPIIAVTGTNGKTTVVNMITHILRSCGYNAALAGNIGEPLAKVVMQGEPVSSEPLVLEVSSFQCETFVEFHPQIALITNLAADHLERYESVHDYFAIKFRMAMNLEPHEPLWLGPRVEGDCPGWIRSQKKIFDTEVRETNGIFYRGGMVYLRDGSKQESHGWRSFENMLPQHVLNCLAAVGACWSFGVPVIEALKSLETFKHLPHRLEYVDTVNGIACFDDSKATNLHAMEAALRSVPAPIRLIAGGRAKGDPLDPLDPLIRSKVRSVYLIGEATELFAEAWKSLTEIHRKATLEEAVEQGLKDGEPGDSLLLSPGCASWDMFANYKERGNRFKQAIREYKL